MKTTQQTEKIKEIILNNKEGFTCDFKGNLINKNKGFFVGITNIKGKNLNLLIKKILFIKRVGFKSNKNLLVGGWKDKDNTFYLDLSLYLESFKLTRQIGNIFNQKAIFNLSNFKEVYLK